MNALKEISTISTFSPNNGDILRLYEFMINANEITRKEAQIHFKSKNKSEVRFRVVYKNLKERLIDGVFSNSFPDYSAVKKAHFKIWKNHAAVKILFGSEKSKAAVTLGQETYTQSIKYGLLDAALPLGRALLIHYSTLEPIAAKHKYFKSEVERLQKKQQEEILAEVLYSKITYKVQKKEDLTSLKEEIEALNQIALTNQEYKFNLYNYVGRGHYYQSINDAEQLIENAEKAIKFFNSFDIPLPYTTSFLFYLQIIPNLIQRQEYAKAEAYINKCLELPTVGSYNWHLTLFLQAILGFHSNKPQIAYVAWKKAQKATKKFNSAIIEERWRIVLAYLVWYKKIGRINISEEYRISKFLNEVDILQKDKTGQNISVIIVQMLHYLVDNKKEDYLIKSCRLQKYILTHLRKKKHIRSKNFLRMLQKIVDVDYRKLDLEEKSRRLWRNIREVPLTVSLDLLESELVPFEFLWIEIKKLLR